jgi:hypothetical protein
VLTQIPLVSLFAIQSINALFNGVFNDKAMDKSWFGLPDTMDPTCVEINSNSPFRKVMMQLT